MADLFSNIQEQLTPEQLVANLTQEIRQHDDKYYGKDLEDIPNHEYDAMMKRLESLEKQYPHLVKEDSPTQRVGTYTSTVFSPVAHTTPMLSIANAMDESERNNFAVKVASELGIPIESLYLTREPKYDGLSIGARFRYGVFYQAVTRGDGFVGEDVTENVRTIKNFPKKIKFDGVAPEFFEVRGEVLMEINDFNDLNNRQRALGKKEYANPRNSASGSLRQLDPKITESRNLKFYAFGYSDDLKHKMPDTQFETIKYLQFMGFECSKDIALIKAIDIEQDYHLMSEIRPKLSFEIDGILYKLNQLSHQKELGWNSKTPKWAVAAKFPADMAYTLCTGIDVQIGRTGVVTPVARLDPVKVAGVTVTNATLFNLNEVYRRDVRPGDMVVVCRGGDVVPQCLGSHNEDPKRSRPKFTMPTNCPVCNSAIVQPEGKAAFVCTGGFLCSAQKEERLIHFASRMALNIEGLGDSAAAGMLEVGLIDDRLSRLYELTVEDLLRLPGFQSTKANNLMDAIENSVGATLDRFIFALGIPGVGEGGSKILAKSYRNWRDFSQATFDDLKKLPEFGVITANSVVKYLDSNYDELRQLADYIKPANMEVIEVGDAFDGMTFVVTGTMSVTREAIEKMIEAEGGKISGSVSKKTSVVVVGEDAGSKAKKADDLKIDIWSEDDLREAIKKAYQNNSPSKKSLTP